MRTRLTKLGVLAAVTALAIGSAMATGARVQDDPVFSGPQVGEKLTPFQVKGVFGELAGKEMDFVTQAGGKPILLIFVHEANRPSVAMTRALITFANQRSKDLSSGVVWLADDPTEAEAFLKRAQHALADTQRIGISKDGAEGPGAYGLNRNVTLTVLVGNKNEVTANYALIQPSLQADAPKIMADVVKQIGGEVPSLKDLGMDQGAAMRPKKAQAKKEQAKGQAANPEAVERLRPLIQPVIRRDATPEEVEKAAEAVEKAIATDEVLRREVGRIAQTITNSGRIGNYGTPKAQEIIRGWAKKYGADSAPTTKPVPLRKGAKKAEAKKGETSP